MNSNRSERMTRGQTFSKEASLIEFISAIPAVQQRLSLLARAQDTRKEDQKLFHNLGLKGFVTKGPWRGAVQIASRATYCGASNPVNQYYFHMQVLKQMCFSKHADSFKVRALVQNLFYICGARGCGGMRHPPRTGNHEIIRQI